MHTLNVPILYRPRKFIGAVRTVRSKKPPPILRSYVSYGGFAKQAHKKRRKPKAKMFLYENLKPEKRFCA